MGSEPADLGEGSSGISILGSLAVLYPRPCLCRHSALRANSVPFHLLQFALWSGNGSGPGASPGLPSPCRFATALALRIAGVLCGPACLAKLLAFCRRGRGTGGCQGRHPEYSVPITAPASCHPLPP